MRTDKPAEDSDTMDKRYSDIPAQGKHRGQTPDQDLSTSVRAPMPSDVTAKGRPVGQTFVHLRNDMEGWHRIRAHEAGHMSEPVSGTQELGRYTSMKALGDVIAHYRDNQRYIVFENTRTGEVFYENETNLHDNWTGDGRFDQITLFDNQEDAAAYADRQQKVLNR